MSNQIIDKLHKILKGIRFKFGYTQKQLSEKLCVSQSTIQRWESNQAVPEVKNINKLISLINEENLDVANLIDIGNIDLKLLLENFKNETNFSYNECSKLFGILPATLSYIVRSKIKPNPSTINKILVKYGEVKNLDDKRKLLFDLYKQDVTDKTLLKLAENYPKIIGFRNENNSGKSFETKVANVFKNMGFMVFRNPILADKSLLMRYCIDIYAVKDGMEICIECKKLSPTQLRNRLGNFLTQLSNLKEISQYVIMALDCNLTDQRKALGLSKGIILIDSNDIDGLKKLEDIYSVLKLKNISLPQRIDSGEDIKSLRNFYNLSYVQFGRLIGYSPVEIFRVEKSQRKLTANFKHKIEEFIEKAQKTNARELHSLASKYKISRKHPQLLHKFEGAENLDKIINFLKYNYTGRKLEKKVSKILTKIGFKVFENVVLANEDVSETYEVDLYAVKDGIDVLIEVKNKLRPHNISSMIRELNHKSKILKIDKTVLILNNKILDRMNKFKNNSILVFTNPETLEKDLMNSFS